MSCNPSTGIQQESQKRRVDSTAFCFVSYPRCAAIACFASSAGSGIVSISHRRVFDLSPGAPANGESRCNLSTLAGDNRTAQKTLRSSFVSVFFGRACVHLPSKVAYYVTPILYDRRYTSYKLCAFS